MDYSYSAKGAKDYTINRVLQFVCLCLTFLFSSFYTNRSAVYEIAYIMGGEIDSRFIISTMIMSSVLVTGVYYLGIKIIYSISDRIYKNQIIKELVKRQDLHNSVERLPSFPVQYDIFKWEMSWMVAAINIIVGLIRLLYFYAPYSIGIIEAVIPPVINVLMMSLYYVRLKNKYLDDNNKGIVFVSLVVPYSIFLIIFV